MSRVPPRGTGKKYPLWLLVAALLSSAVALPKPASAEPPNDKNHSIRKLTSTTYPSYATIANTGSQVAVNTFVSQTLWTSSQLYTVPSGASGTDITTGFTTSTSNGGYYLCTNVASSGRCLVAIVRYSPDYWTSTQKSAVEFWSALACHELGHGINLAHSAGLTCMNSNYMASSYNLSDARRLDPFQVSAANAVYGAIP